MSAAIVGRVVVLAVAAVAATIAYVKYRNDQRQQHQHRQGSRGDGPPPADDNDRPSYKHGGSSWETDQDDIDMVRSRTKSKSSSSSRSEEKGCPICFETYSRLTRRGVPLMTTPCGHVFCKNCLLESLSRSRLCPFCRNEIDSSKCHQIFL